MKNVRALLISFALIIVASLGFGWWWRVHNAPLGNVYLSVRTPDEIKAMITTAEPRAALTVINFWASWCEPCKREFPTFLRLRKEFADRGVRLIFVSVDDGADFADAERFLHDNGVDFPTFYKGRQSLNFVAELIPNWTGAVPATVILGPDAGVLQTFEGEVTWADLEKRINAHLGEQRDDQKK